MVPHFSPLFLDSPPRPVPLQALSPAFRLPADHLVSPSLAPLPSTSLGSVPPSTPHRLRASILPAGLSTSGLALARPWRPRKHRLCTYPQGRAQDSPQSYSDSPGQGSIWEEGEAGLTDNQDPVWWKEAVSRQRELRGTGLELRTRATAWEL